MIAVVYGYARVSKTDRDDRNIETQLHQLEQHGVRRELVYVDDASGTTFNRPGWRQLAERLQLGDTVVVCNLARFSRNFDEGAGSRPSSPSAGSGSSPSSIRPIWHCQLVREPRQDATLGIDEGLWDVRWSWCRRSTESGWQHRKRDGSGR